MVEKFEKISPGLVIIVVNVVPTNGQVLTATKAELSKYVPNLKEISTIHGKTKEILANKLKFSAKPLGLLAENPEFYNVFIQ